MTFDLIIDLETKIAKNRCYKRQIPSVLLLMLTCTSMINRRRMAHHSVRGAKTAQGNKGARD